MKNLKAVLFDLDGTLIDSEYFYFSNWQPILSQEFNFTIDFGDWIEHFAGHTLVDNVRLLKEKWGIDTTEEFMWTETRANYAKSDMRTIRLMPYAAEILAYLQRQDIRMGLVTSSYQTTVDTVLGHHGLLSYFEFFVTRERVIKPKPHPEPYRLGIQSLGLATDQILALEDTSTGVAAAKGAGLSCFAVTKHATERAKLTMADRLFFDLNEVIQAFEHDALG